MNENKEKDIVAFGDYDVQLVHITHDKVEGMPKNVYFAISKIAKALTLNGQKEAALLKVTEEYLYGEAGSPELLFVGPLELACSPVLINGLAFTEKESCMLVVDKDGYIAILKKRIVKSDEDQSDDIVTKESKQKATLLSDLDLVYKTMTDKRKQK